MDNPISETFRVFGESAPAMKSMAEAKAVGLKGQSPLGWTFSSQSFALSARWLQPRGLCFDLLVGELAVAGGYDDDFDGQF